MHRRISFQFSLRTILLLATVTCVFLGITVDATYREYRAVEALDRLGARRLDCLNLGRWPKWSLKLLGESQFRHTFYVDFRCDRFSLITSAEIDMLRDLPFLEEVWFLGVGVSDEAIDRLAELRGIQRVVLAGESSIGKQSLQTLKNRFPVMETRSGARTFEVIGCTSLTRLPGVGFAKTISGASVN